MCRLKLKEASETNVIAGDSKQIDYKIQETIISLYGNHSAQQKL